MASQLPDDLVPGILLERLVHPDPERREAAARGLGDMLQERVRELQLRPLPSGNPPQGLARPEVRAWNWGAFLCGPAWALAHGMAFLALALLLLFWAFPLVNVGLGLFGGTLAWKVRKFDDVEDFARVQRGWAWAGLFFFPVQLALVLGLVLFLAFPF